MKTKEKLKEYGSEALALAVLLICYGIYAVVRDVLLAMPAEPLVIVNSVLALSFGLKFWTNRKLCGIVTPEESRWYLLHLLHNALCIFMFWISLGYGAYVNFYGSSKIGLGVGIELALFLEIIYFFTHNTKSNRNWKTACSYLVATLIITFFVSSMSTMIQMMGAEHQSTSQVVVTELTTYGGTKDKRSKTYKVQVQYETGEQEQFEVSKTNYYEYDPGTRLTITKYKGMTGATWTKLEQQQSNQY